MTMPNRKNIRLPYHNYSKPGAYFITICTKDKKEILSEVIESDSIFESPKTDLLYHGKIADKYLKQMDEFYINISLEKYVIMPNHVHLIIRILATENHTERNSPLIKADNKNSVIAKFVSTFKRFCNKECGESIWQSRSYDHVIRNDRDYNDIYSYVENNPGKWIEDRFHPDNRLQK